MADNSLTRREMLKATAAIGMAALAGSASGLAMDAPKPAGPTIGIQMGLPPLATGDLDQLFDDLRKRGGGQCVVSIYLYIRACDGGDAGQGISWREFCDSTYGILWADIAEI